jgi:hypothetical protein
MRDITILQEFDSRPHQQGVMHGPYLPSGAVEIGLGYDQAIHQLDSHQEAVIEAEENGAITVDAATILSDGLEKVLNRVYDSEQNAADRYQRRHPFGF